MRSLDRIAATLGASQQDVITPLRITVRDLKTSFDSLVNEQKSLGYNESRWHHRRSHRGEQRGREHHPRRSVVGRRRRRPQAADVASDHAPLRDGLPADALAHAEQHFLDEVKNFNALFESVDGAPSMKQKLNEQVQTYSYAFAQWVASTDNIEPLLALIGHDTESVLPEADKIIASAQDSASEAATALAASRARIRSFIICGSVWRWC